MPEESPESKVLSFLHSRYAVPTGIALTLVISFLLLMAEKDGTLWMATLLIAIAGYIIPKNFGLKDLKWQVLWGVAFVTIITTMAFAFTYAYYDDNPDTVSASEGGGLVQGTVRPLGVAEDGNYTFEVVVVDNLSNVTVHVGAIDAVYLEAWNGDVDRTVLLENTSSRDDGWVYSGDAELEEDRNHFFYFTAEADGEVETDLAVGPLTMRGSDAWLFYWSQNFNQIFILVGMPFFFLAFVSWWMGRSIERAVVKMEEEGRIPPRDGRPCVKCGTPLSKDAEVCPGCGRVIPQYTPPQKAMVEEPVEEETLVCSECGAEVPEDAEVCPTCGEEFED